jgi:hypothetical protein
VEEVGLGQSWARERKRPPVGLGCGRERRDGPPDWKQRWARGGEQSRKREGVFFLFSFYKLFEIWIQFCFLNLNQERE